MKSSKMKLCLKKHNRLLSLLFFWGGVLLCTLHSCAVNNQLAGILDWNTGMEYWNDLFSLNLVDIAYNYRGTNNSSSHH